MRCHVDILPAQLLFTSMTTNRTLITYISHDNNGKSVRELAVTDQAMVKKCQLEQLPKLTRRADKSVRSVQEILAANVHIAAQLKQTPLVYEAIANVTSGGLCKDPQALVHSINIPAKR